jgi:hypothetical protein
MKSTYGLVCAAACALASAVWSHPAHAQGRAPSGPSIGVAGPQSAPEKSSTEAARPGEREGAGVHFGALGSLGFPRPLSVEGVLEIDRLFLVGAEYGVLPTTTIGGVQSNLWSIAADVRVFPFRNGFFVGLRAGRQHLGESTTVTAPVLGSISPTIDADTTFVNPRIGFLWSFQAFKLGVDAGAQIPISTSTTSTVPAEVPVPSALSDVNRTLGQQVIPTLDLLQIGIVM